MEMSWLRRGFIFPCFLLPGKEHPTAPIPQHPSHSPGSTAPRERSPRVGCSRQRPPGTSSAPGPAPCGVRGADSAALPKCSPTSELLGPNLVKALQAPAESQPGHSLWVLTVQGTVSSQLPSPNCAIFQKQLISFFDGFFPLSHHLPPCWPCCSHPCPAAPAP